MVDDTLFHENTHAILTKIEKAPIRLGKYLYENATTRSRIAIKEEIEANYQPHEYYEEMLTNWMSPFMATGYGVKLLNSTPVAYRPMLQYLFNTLKYEPEREELQRRSNVRQSARRTGVPRVSWSVPERQRTEEGTAGQSLTADERRAINDLFPGTFEGDVRMSVNSQGKELTPSQQEFFGNSKAVDKDGNLLVVYHGTPRAGFTEFKSG